MPIQVYSINDYFSKLVTNLFYLNRNVSFVFVDIDIKLIV